MNLPAVSEYDNKVNIKNAKMFYSDTNMVFLDKDDPGKVYRYDLPKGKIVEEWVI
jgi:hypothetical protein